MISSSKFFQKDLFTIEASNKKEIKQKEQSRYGPWDQSSQLPIQRPLKNKKKSKRYDSLDQYLHLSQSKMPETSNLLSARFKSISARKQTQSSTLAPNDQFRKQLKFPKIKEADLTEKINHCLALNNNLNFISKSRQNRYTKKVSRPNYDFIKPRVEPMQKSFTDARKYFYDCKNQNTLFYNS